MTRPKTLVGITVEKEVACGSFYVTINYDDNKICEVFVRGARRGGCRANQETIGRLISELLNYTTPENVADILKGINCPACQTLRGELRAKGKSIKDIPLSCGDGIARAILENKGVK
jgi:ribonucleoside-diphosphate reductase alpha chain